jgi:hypothetical protein
MQTQANSNQDSAVDDLRARLLELGYKLVPDSKVSQATNLILTYAEVTKLETLVKTLIKAELQACLDELSKSFKDEKDYKGYMVKQVIRARGTNV